MGYDVHVTRRQPWHDEAGPEISLQEWKSLVEGDPEMRLDNLAEVNLPNGGIFRVESEGLAVWTAYSHDGGNGNMAWFSWGRGEITVKNPDTEILAKMWQLAQSLSAIVQGDEEEQYDSQGNPCVAETDHEKHLWKMILQKLRSLYSR